VASASNDVVELGARTSA